MAGKSVNIKEYNKLVDEIDKALESKRVSYASFSAALGITAITFYNRYKSCGFSLKDLQYFLKIAKDLPPNQIKCLKCGKSFLPKAKSVKRAFCEECKEELQKKSDKNDIIRFKYPAWVTGINSWAIRNLVEQEFHIDEETAMAMSEAETPEDAKAIRANRWKSSLQFTSSVVYDTLTEIRF
jgi:hypothetical protein